MAKLERITKESLLHVHQNNNTDNIDEHKNELIGALGGLDNILTMILSSNDTTLSHQQLTQIERIINPNNTLVSEQEDNDSIIANRLKQVDENQNPPQWVYCFNSNNTYLHTLFGDDTGKTIFQLIYSKRCIFATLILISFLSGTSFMFYFLKMLIWSNIMLQIAFVIGAIYLILLLLSANRKCLRLCFESFEYWLKCYYFMQYSVAAFVYYYALTDSEEWDEYGSYSVPSGSILYYLEMLSYLLQLLCTSLLVVVFLSIDSLQLNLRVRRLVGVLIGILSTAVAINITFILETNPSTIIHVKFLDIHFSVRDLMVSGMQILSVLFWKQTILSILKRNKCILIKYSPYIQWRDYQNGSATGFNINSDLKSIALSHEMNLMKHNDLCDNDDERP